MSQPAEPIIIIKKKGGGHGHHGGAWKVAYADFVTAMMALFIVLWLLNSSQQVKEAVGGYFKDPQGYGKKVGTNLAGVGEALTVKKEDMSKLKDQLQQAMKQRPELQKLKDNVMITVTGEGLRIELLESEKGHFFESGNAKPTAVGDELITMLAKELGGLKNNLLIEGHTDAQPYGTEGGYTNWELSADRANTARRVMQAHGIRADQVKQVRGYADQKLRKPDSPLDASNRRVSILVQYEIPPEKEDSEPATGGHGGSHGAKPDGHAAAQHAAAKDHGDGGDSGHGKEAAPPAKSSGHH